MLEHDVIIRDVARRNIYANAVIVFIEAGSSEEALPFCRNPSEPVGVVLSGAQSGFRLSGWLKANRPDVKIILTATPERAAQAKRLAFATPGPAGKRPYDPQMLVQEIKFNLAKGPRLIAQAAAGDCPSTWLPIERRRLLVDGAQFLITSNHARCALARFGRESAKFQGASF